MTTLIHHFKLGKARSEQHEPRATIAPGSDRPLGNAAIRSLDIAPNDPLVAYFRSSPGVVEIDKLHLDSPMVGELRE